VKFEAVIFQSEDMTEAMLVAGQVPEILPKKLNRFFGGAYEIGSAWAFDAEQVQAALEEGARPQVRVLDGGAARIQAPVDRAWVAAAREKERVVIALCHRPCEPADLAAMDAEHLEELLASGEIELFAVGLAPG
jgi:hypothetical protein